MKKFIYIIALCLAGTLLTANESIVANYDFGEGTGKVLKDKSGNGLDCKILNGKWVKTQFGNAVEFTGKNIGAYSPINSAKLNVGKDSFTICIFLKIPETTKTFRILEKGAGDGYNGYRLYFRGKLGLIIGVAKPVHYKVANGNGGFKNKQINDGKWHFVSFVFNRDKNMQLYIDGIPTGKPINIKSLEGLPVVNKERFRIYRGIKPESSCIISSIVVYRQALTEVKIKEKHANILQKR